MTIALITDGMLYPIISDGSGGSIRAPDGAQGYAAAIPAPPCNPTGIQTLSHFRHALRGHRAYLRKRQLPPSFRFVERTSQPLLLYTINKRCHYDRAR